MDRPVSNKFDIQQFFLIQPIWGLAVYLNKSSAGTSFYPLAPAWPTSPGC